MEIAVHWADEGSMTSPKCDAAAGSGAPFCRRRPVGDAAGGPHGGARRRMRRPNARAGTGDRAGRAAFVTGDRRGRLRDQRPLLVLAQRALPHAVGDAVADDLAAAGPERRHELGRVVVHGAVDQDRAGQPSPSSRAGSRQAPTRLPSSRQAKSGTAGGGPPGAEPPRRAPRRRRSAQGSDRRRRPAAGRPAKS